MTWSTPAVTATKHTHQEEHACQAKLPVADRPRKGQEAEERKTVHQLVLHTLVPLIEGLGGHLAFQAMRSERTERHGCHHHQRGPSKGLPFHAAKVPVPAKAEAPGFAGAS